MATRVLQNSFLKASFPMLLLASWVVLPGCEQSKSYRNECTDCADDDGSDDGSSDDGTDDGSSDDDDGSGTDEDVSTLCYEVTTSGGTQNLEINCTPDATVTCADLGLDASEFEYSSRAVCMEDAQNVLDHWVETGEIGGASPDGGGSSSSGGGSDQCPPGYTFSPSGEEPPRGDFALHFVGCHVGSYGGADWLQWGSAEGGGGQCYLPMGAAQTPQEELCNVTIHLDDIYGSDIYEAHWHVQLVDAPYTLFSDSWRPAFDGDSSSITLQ